METLSPVGLDNVMFADGALHAAYFGLEMKSASSAPVNSPADEDEDIDGCCVQVEVPTSDEELPVAEGGVA